MAIFEKHQHVNVWWFPQNFCQSRYGKYRDSGTNSCTLISLILADKMSKEQVFRTTNKILPKRAIELFGAAMNEGNIVYANLFKNNKKETPNLNIPEAMSALEEYRNIQFDLREWFYTHLTANPHKESYRLSIANRITQVLKLAIQLFRQGPNHKDARNLFAALIADSRTTVFVFDFHLNVVSFFDSHQHAQKAGAVMAQTSLENLPELCYWFMDMLEDIYNSRPTVFEISFLITSADAPNLKRP